MAVVLTSPLAFMVRIRAICNIEGGPAHPGPLFFARTSAELRFSRQIAKGNFPREQLGVGHFFNGAIGKRFCPASPLASLLALFLFLFI